MRAGGARRLKEVEIETHQLVRIVAGQAVDFDATRVCVRQSLCAKPAPVPRLAFASTICTRHECGLFGMLTEPVTSVSS